MSKVVPPRAVILAGPNGAGKTTASPFLIRDAMGIRDFINADAIAHGLSGFDPATVDFAAGRIMLQRLRALTAENRDFAFETTLSSRGFAPWLQKLRRKGYIVELHFLWLPEPSLAVERVRDRVAKGGHAVPEHVIRRRYGRGLQNLFSLYVSRVDEWYIYDNSGFEPALVAYTNRAGSEILQPSLWTMIVKQGSRDT